MAIWKAGLRNSEVFNIHKGEITLDVFSQYIDKPFGTDEITIEVPETIDEIERYKNLLNNGYKFIGVYGESLRMYKEFSGDGKVYSTACVSMWKEYTRYATTKLDKMKLKEEVLTKMRELIVKINCIKEELSMNSSYVLLQVLEGERKVLDAIVCSYSK